MNGGRPDESCLFLMLRDTTRHASTLRLPTTSAPPNLFVSWINWLSLATVWIFDIVRRNFDVGD